MNNKVAGIILIILGLIPALLCKEGTGFVLFTIAGIALIFAKTNYMKGPYEEEHNYEDQH